MRFAGMRLAVSSSWSRATRFISEANAPGAIALTTMLSSARRNAIRRVNWISPALLAAYEYVSCGFTEMPSIDAMLMTLAGCVCAAARSGAISAWVRKNGDFRFRSTTLSQPFSGKVSKVSPQAAPALLTRMSSVASRAV